MNNDLPYARPHTGNVQTSISITSITYTPNKVKANNLAVTLKHNETNNIIGLGEDGWNREMLIAFSISADFIISGVLFTSRDMCMQNA